MILENKTGCVQTIIRCNPIGLLQIKEGGTKQLYSSTLFSKELMPKGVKRGSLVEFYTDEIRNSLIFTEGIKPIKSVQKERVYK